MKEITPLIDVPPVDELITDIDNILNKPPIAINTQNFKRIPKEDLFWAQYSTLQVWSENNYDTHHNYCVVCVIFIEYLPNINKIIPIRKGNNKKGNVWSTVSGLYETIVMMSENPYESEIINPIMNNTIPNIFFLFSFFPH